MRKIFFTRPIQLFAIMAALAIPGLARADAVTNFHSDVHVSRDNVVSIKETITYDPGSESHHGIIRYVPAQFGDSSGHKYYTSVRNYSVTDQSGKRYPIAASHNNRQELYLKIGDAKHLIDGPKTYVIYYEITPLVVKGDGFDRLTLNITGQQWTTFIDQADATVEFDPGVNITNAACFTGTTGSTAHDCLATGNGSSAYVSTTKPLALSEGLTVDLHLSPGSASTYLLPDHPLPLSGAEKAVMVLIGAGGLVFLVALVRLVSAWMSERRERKSQTIIPLYQPPDGLKAAQLSVLESPQSDVADISATLIDLAVRGYIKIDQIQAKTWYRQANYRFTKPKSLDGLDQFETDLAGALFSSGESVELKDLRYKATTMSLAIQNMRKHLGDDLKSKGYYTTAPTQSWTVLKLVAFLISPFMFVLAALALPDGVSGSTMLLVFGFLAAFAALGLTYVKTGRTLAGNQEWAKVAGFKWFLSVTEKDRLAFTDAPDKTPELFSAMLPYAIALKVEKQWAKQFEGIDVGQAVGGWYGGYNGALFASDFASGFSSSFSGAMSSSFAGSSGGGGAGGGGGGGGGGGW